MNILDTGTNAVMAIVEIYPVTGREIIEHSDDKSTWVAYEIGKPLKRYFRVLGGIYGATIKMRITELNLQCP